MPDNPYQLSFWDGEDGELWDEIASTMLEIYLQGVDGGVAALPKNISVLADFDHINTNAMDWAKQYRYTLVKGITDTTRTQTQKAVSDWIASGAPLDALEQTLERIYGPVRARMIAQTESTRVFAMGNQAAFESTGVVDQVEWRSSEDASVCPVCASRAGMRFGVGDIDSLPPNSTHIGCRCWIQPVVSERAVAAQLDEVFSE